MLKSGDLAQGVFWAGMVQGLINDIPTVKDLLDRIMAEAEAIVSQRLAGMLKA
jgi:nitronate monooxygenase